MNHLCDLHNCPDNTFPWHWHNEVEFFYMREEELIYQISSGTYTFREGEGGFINSNILHMTRCRQELPCIQEEHIFLPQFIGGSENSIFMRKYIVPITSNGDFEIFRLNPNCKEQKEIIALMAESCNKDASFISVRECCRCFKENLNTTPFSYLIDYRLYKSCELLSHTSMSITEIAITCGFGSSSYFTKLFREKFSCTPGEYRK